MASTGTFALPDSGSGISTPDGYVTVRPSGVETYTCRRSGSTTQNSLAPFSRQSFSLSYPGGRVGGRQHLDDQVGCSVQTVVRIDPGDARRADEGDAGDAQLMFR
jgi:hypothetical protein